MDNIDVPKELGRAAIAAVVAFVAALILKALALASGLPAPAAERLVELLLLQQLPRLI
jgi:hypothetical protein